MRPWGAGVGASLSLTLPRLPQSAERVLAPHEGGEEEPSGVRARQGSKALRVGGGGRDCRPTPSSREATSWEPPVGPWEISDPASRGQLRAPATGSAACAQRSGEGQGPLVVSGTRSHVVGSWPTALPRPAVTSRGRVTPVGPQAASPDGGGESGGGLVGAWAADRKAASKTPQDGSREGVPLLRRWGHHEATTTSTAAPTARSPSGQDHVGRCLDSAVGPATLLRPSLTCLPCAPGSRPPGRGFCPPGSLSL